MKVVVDSNPSSTLSMDTDRGFQWTSCKSCSAADAKSAGRARSGMARDTVRTYRQPQCC